jgi:hypothetical protein
MFFVTLIAAPVLAGLVAGVWTSRRTVPASLAGLAVTLGIAGAIVMAFNSDNRGENITFGVLAGLICAGLVWIGYAFGRISRRSVGTA